MSMNTRVCVLYVGAILVGAGLFAAGFFTDNVRKNGVPEISEYLVARIEAEHVESLGSSP